MDWFFEHHMPFALIPDSEPTGLPRPGSRVPNLVLILTVRIGIGGMVLINPVANWHREQRSHCFEN
jgi:hypothetical protein